MITLIVLIALLLVCMAFSLCFHLVGGVLKLAVKLVICLPCAVLSAIVGAALCCTLILIPVGIACFKLAGWFLNPFKLCAV